MSKIRIPTEDELARSLTGLDRLLTAKRWERAAIVWAFTTDDNKGGGNGSNQHRSNLSETPQVAFPCSIFNFARLGFAGLRDRETVARYRAAWRGAIDHGAAVPVEPGDEIDLPDLPWPPVEAKWPIRHAEAESNIDRAVTKNPDGARAVLDALQSPAEKAALARFYLSDPEVAAEVVTDHPETVGRVTSAWLGTIEGTVKEKSEQIREALKDPAVAAEVADRETVEKVARAYQDKQSTPKVQPRETVRDYEKMVDQGVNLLSVALAAEKSGVWQTPSPQAEALLYFLALRLTDRKRPPGDWDDLISEVEAFANLKS